MTQKRLLLLSGGCQVGQNVLATLAGRRDRLLLQATSSIPDEPALFAFDAVHLVPVTTVDPDEMERRLLRIVASERIDLVVPCRDDDVLFLAAVGERRPDLASRFLCGSRSAAEAISDKWAGYRFCVDRGLPFVETLDRSTADRDWLPCIAKPRRGYASHGVCVVWTPEQLDQATRDDALVIQRYIGDPETIRRFVARMEATGLPMRNTFQTVKHSIQALLARDGSIVHVICTRNELHNVRAKRVSVDEDPAARELGMRCAAAFAEAGWRGPLNIQCQRGVDGRLLIHEFNGRFTGATAVRWRLGFDEVGAAIGAFTGLALDDRAGPRAKEALEGFTSRAADPADVDALAREGVWRAPRQG